MMEKTITDLVPEVFPKILDDSGVHNWGAPIQDDILYACVTLIDVINVRLRVSHPSSIIASILSQTHWSRRD